MLFRRRLGGHLGARRLAAGLLQSAKTRNASTRSPATSVEELQGDTQCSVSREALLCALKRRLGDPAAPLASNLIYEKLVNPSRIIAEFNFAKTTRRVARQKAAFRFLRHHNVLLHGLLFYAPHTATWNTTPEFARLSLLGQSVVDAEVRGRLLKLFPDMPHDAYAASVRALTSRPSLVTLFDALSLEQIVGARPPLPNSTASPSNDSAQRSRASSRVKVTLSVDEKAAMLCALVGEMYWFAARTKATDRTHNNALFPPSDVLILHVLCTHLLECVPAELMFRELAPMVQQIRSVWVNEPMSLPAQLHLTPHTIRAHSLSAFPHLATPEELQRRSVPAGARVTCAPALTNAPDAHYFMSHMRPAVSHKRFDALMSSSSHSAADRIGQAPVLSPERTASPTGERDRGGWNEARRRELSSPARQHSEASPADALPR